MSHYIKDINSGKLIYVKNTEENIQALRAAIILNEVLPSIPGGESLQFGDIKIISRANGG